MNISGVDFHSRNFASFGELDQDSEGYNYRGPQFPVSQVVAAVVAQGAILPIDPPSSRPNASYATTFYGPALQCTYVSNTMYDNITEYVNRTFTGFDYCSGFISWVGDLNFVSVEENETLSIDSGTLEQANWQWAPSGQGAWLGISGNQTANVGARIYVAVFPNMQDAQSMEGGHVPTAESNATIIQCQLTNVTYHASFIWSNGVRTVDVALSQPLNLVPATFYVNDWLTSPAPWAEAVLLEYLAYQSVMDAFGAVLVGVIGTTLMFASTERTSVMNTVIGNVPELRMLRSQANRQIANFMLVNNSPALDANITGALGLKETLELLFQNITLSLATSEFLRSEFRRRTYHECSAQMLT